MQRRRSFIGSAIAALITTLAAPLVALRPSSKPATRVQMRKAIIWERKGRTKPLYNVSFKDLRDGDMMQIWSSPDDPAHLKCFWVKGNPWRSQDPALLGLWGVDTEGV